MTTQSRVETVCPSSLDLLGGPRRGVSTLAQQGCAHSYGLEALNVAWRGGARQIAGRWDGGPVMTLLRVKRRMQPISGANAGRNGNSRRDHNRLWSAPLPGYTAFATLPSHAKVRPCWIASKPSRHGSEEWKPMSISPTGRCRDLTQSRKLRVCAMVSGSSV